MKPVIQIIVGLTTFFLLLALSGCTTTKDFYGLILVNNSQAKDVSSIELVKFLAQDKTKEHSIVPYVHKSGVPLGNVIAFNKDGEAIGTETLHDYVTSGYQCVNFAVDLHNNAEKSGIRCGIAVDTKHGHCINVFATKDRGIVYADASAGSDSPSYYDPNLGKTVIPYCKIKVGEGIGDTWTEFVSPEYLEVEW